MMQSFTNDAQDRIAKIRWFQLNMTILESQYEIWDILLF